MTRPNTRTSIAAIALAFAAACSEPSANPAAAPEELPRARKLATGEESWAQFNGYEKSFTIDPSRTNVVYLWEHRVVFDPASICAAGSSYGVTEWDKPCDPSTVPTQIKIKLEWDRWGEPSVKVTPDVRFVPGRNVMLYLKDAVGSLDPRSVILWCNNSGSSSGSSLGNHNGSGSGRRCVDEGLADHSLKTHRDPLRGYLFRKLKHFSGYEVAAT